MLPSVLPRNARCDGRWDLALAFRRCCPVILTAGRVATLPDGLPVIPSHSTFPCIFVDPYLVCTDLHQAIRVHRGFPDTVAPWGVGERSGIHRHDLVLDGVDRRTGGGSALADVPAPTDEVLLAQLDKKLVGCLMKPPTRRGVFIEAWGSPCAGERWPLQPRWQLHHAPGAGP